MSRAVALRLPVGLLGALLVAVLAGGLLGMHTLGLHGTAHGGHGADAVQAAAHDAHGSATAVDEPVDGPADGTAMACLFLLVVVGALLLVPGLRGGLRGGLTLPRPPPAARAPAPPVVDGRPPPLLAWAVVRC